VAEKQGTAETKMTDEQLLNFSHDITNDEKRWQVPEKGTKFDIEELVDMEMEPINGEKKTVQVKQIDKVVSESFAAFQDQYDQYVKIMNNPDLEQYRPDAKRWLELGTEAYERETQLKSGIAENVFASLDKDGRESFRDAGSTFDEDKKEYAYQPLTPEQQAEYTQRFLEAFKAMWKDRVATHQKSEKVLSHSDLDGEASLYLLQKIAKLTIGDLEFVPKGQSIEGKINIDTGNKDAVGTNLYELAAKSTQKETGFIDHHGNESNKDTSATLWVYDILKEMNLIKKDGVKIKMGIDSFVATPEDIEKFVEIVTHDDNKDFPNMDEYYKKFPDTYNTMMGLLNYVYPQYLLKFIHDGHDLFEELNYVDIKKYKLARDRAKRDKDNNIILKPDGTPEQEWVNYSNLRKEQIDGSLLEVKEKIAPDKGFTLKSEDFGRIFVDLSDSVSGKDEASKSLDFDTYILWNYDESTKKSGFFITSKKGIPFDFRLSEGQNVRGRIVIKPAQEDASDLTLHEILKQMGVDDTQLRGELKDYIDTQEVDHAEVAAKLDAERREALSKKFEPQGAINTDPNAFVDAIKYYESESTWPERKDRLVLVEHNGKFWRVISTDKNKMSGKREISFREYDPITDSLIPDIEKFDFLEAQAWDSPWYRGPKKGEVTPPTKPADSTVGTVEPVVPVIPKKITPEPAPKTPEKNIETIFSEAFADGSEWAVVDPRNAYKIKLQLGIKSLLGDSVEIKIIENDQIFDSHHLVSVEIKHIAKDGHSLASVVKDLSVYVLMNIAKPKAGEWSDDIKKQAQDYLMEAGNSVRNAAIKKPEITPPVAEEVKIIPVKPELEIEEAEAVLDKEKLAVPSAETTDEIDKNLLAKDDQIVPVLGVHVLGYEVDKAKVGSNVPKLMSTSDSSRYYIDTTMPDVNGYIRVREIRQTPLGTKKVILALQPGDVEASFYLAKPRVKTEEEVQGSGTIANGEESVMEPEIFEIPELVNSPEVRSVEKDYSLVENVLGKDYFILNCSEADGGPLKLEVGQKWESPESAGDPDEIISIRYIASLEKTDQKRVDLDRDRLQLDLINKSGEFPIDETIRVIMDDMLGGFYGVAEQQKKFKLEQSSAIEGK
jgi:hypothetical protein